MYEIELEKLNDEVEVSKSSEEDSTDVSRTEDDDDAWRSEAKHIFRLSGPLIVDFASQVGLSFTDTIFLGHVGSRELAAAAIGVAWTLSAMYLFSGLVFGLDSVVSQAHGARNLRIVDRAFQTALFLVAVGSIPVSIAYYKTEDVLLFVGQTKEIASLAGYYARWLIIGILPAHLSRASVRYLQMRGIVFPSMVAGALSLAANIVLNLGLIFGVGDWGGLGFIGAAIATSISRFINLALIWGYIWLFSAKGFSWTGWHRDAFNVNVIVEYLRVGVPASLMFWLEETSFNLMTILIGLLHHQVSTVASAICMTVLVGSFIIPIAFGSAGASRIGFLLGAGKPLAAKSVTAFCVKVGLVVMFINSLVIFFARRLVINAFLAPDEQTPEVLDLSMKLLTFLSLVVYIDGQQIIGGSLIRGIGYPTQGFVINLVSHYIISNPIGALLAFVLGFGVFGFYMGLGLGLLFAGVVYWIVLWRVDWKVAADKATTEYSSQDTDTALPPQALFHYRDFVPPDV